MKMRRRILTIALAFAALSCQPAPQGFLEIDGWLPQGEPATYDADGLWELINGAADTFLAYGFEEVTVQRYSQQDVTTSIAVYDMGTPLDAFGIYRTEAPAEEPALPIGAEAVVSPPYQGLLFKERYYVKVEAYEGEIDRAMGEALMSAIAAALPGEDGLPAEFAALPATGMLPGSARYTRESVFGLSELVDCVHAGYTDESGGEYQAFAVLDGSADGVWAKLEAEWQALELDGMPVRFREVPYSGLVGAYRSESQLVGATGAADEAQLLERLRKISSAQ
jgi:hypothetical protein